MVDLEGKGGEALREEFQKLRQAEETLHQQELARLQNRHSTAVRPCCLLQWPALVESSMAFHCFCLGTTTERFFCAPPRMSQTLSLHDPCQPSPPVAQLRTARQTLSEERARWELRAKQELDARLEAEQHRHRQGMADDR
jgi:hypothetical protein